MKMPRDFCSGYASAVADLGREGDYRRVDWSDAHQHLRERLNTFQPVGESLVERLRYRGGLCVEAADDIEKLRVALAWALDIIRTNDARIATLDPEGYAQLDQRADLTAKLKAFAALVGAA